MLRVKGYNLNTTKTFFMINVSYFYLSLASAEKLKFGEKNRLYKLTLQMDTHRNTLNKNKEWTSRGFLKI